MDAEFYLDNAATTRMLPEVLAEALPFLEDCYGNPSSLHALGMDARRAVKLARESLARGLGVPPQAVTFTSGGTESDNLALQGVFGSSRLRGERLLVSAIEHPAVQETASALAAAGAQVERIPVTRGGVVDLARLEGLLSPEVRLVSVMAVNNELGIEQPLADIGRLVRARAPKAVFHVDAVQAFTRLPIPWREARVDLLSLSAHKIHGPKGVGALVRCTPVPLAEQTPGGGQEGGLRSGTENTFGIVAFAAAARLAAAGHQAQRVQRAEYHRAWLDLLAGFPGVRVFRSEQATPFIVNFGLRDIPGEVTLHHLEQQGLMVSTGSACSSHAAEPSPVLLAVGLSEADALSAVRLSFSLFNTPAGLARVFPAFRRAMAALARL